MDNKLICGIDPGINGGICLLEKNGDIHTCVPMPIYYAGKVTEYDITAIDALISGSHYCYIEKAQAMPKMGVKAMFNYGKGYGILITILTTWHIPYQEVRPMTWHKVMLADMPKDKDNRKGSSIKRAKQLKPDFNWLKNNRCRKPHDGMIEAYLITEYGRSLRRKE